MHQLNLAFGALFPGDQRRPEAVYPRGAGLFLVLAESRCATLRPIRRFEFLALAGLSLSWFGSAHAEPLPKLPPISEGAVTVVVMPDTQYYQGPGTKVEAGAGKSLTKLGDSTYVDLHREWVGRHQPSGDEVSNPYLKQHIDWILENREQQRIVFVSHVGDLVDLNQEVEWEIAKEQFSRLRGVLPFGISVGNHDMDTDADASLFQAAFPAASFADYDWYGGSYDHDRADQNVSRENVNSFQRFSAGEIDFLFLHLGMQCP